MTVGHAPPRAESLEPAGGELLTRARAHYDRAIAAQRAGDWSTYGEEIDRLGEVLRQLGPAAPARQP